MDERLQTCVFEMQGKALEYKLDDDRRFQHWLVRFVGCPAASIRRFKVSSLRQGLRGGIGEDCKYNENH